RLHHGAGPAGMERGCGCRGSRVVGRRLRCLVGASLMPTRCTRLENWPAPPFVRGCMCKGCRRSMIDRLADQSLTTALAHAQNRSEGGRFDRYADELTIDRDISVIWSRRMSLPAWRAAPVGRPGDTPPNRSGQWLYKFFLGSSPRPIYLGRVTGRALVNRIDEHLRRGRPIPNLTVSKGPSGIAANN